MADTGVVPPAAASAAAGPPVGDESPSMIGLARGLLGELPGLLSDRVHLFALELRRSGMALARIVAWAVAAAVLLTTAWLALWVGVGMGAVRAGWPWYWVLTGIVLANLVVAWLAVQRALALAPLLALPATLRHLTLAPSPVAADADDTSVPAAPAQADRTLH